jgi:hypothetical protein
MSNCMDFCWKTESNRSSISVASDWWQSNGAHIYKIPRQNYVPKMNCNRCGNMIDAGTIKYDAAEEAAWSADEHKADMPSIPHAACGAEEALGTHPSRSTHCRRDAGWQYFPCIIRTLMSWKGSATCTTLGFQVHPVCHGPTLPLIYPPGQLRFNDRYKRLPCNFVKQKKTFCNTKHNMVV